MASVTGALGGTNLSIPTSDASAALMRTVIAAPGAALVTGNTPPTAAANIVVADPGTTATGTPGLKQSAVLAGQGDRYDVAANDTALVIAADNTGSTIVNTVPTGRLRALTGAGPNTLIGAGLTNAFQTASGGQDRISFAAGALPQQANLLISAGQDTVGIAGPEAGGSQSNTISMLQGGSGMITLSANVSLTFIDASSATSTVTGAAGTSVRISGAGNALLIGGAGAETFDASAASGNVTLVAGQGTETATGGSGADVFRFVQGLAGGATTIVDFNGADTVQLQGYGTAAITAETAIPAGLQITLSDNTTIVLQNVNTLSPGQIRFT